MLQGCQRFKYYPSVMIVKFINEWIDIIIQEKDLFKLYENSIEYTIIIDDIDKLSNSVRGQYHTFPEYGLHPPSDLPARRNQVWLWMP